MDKIKEEMVRTSKFLKKKELTESSEKERISEGGVAALFPLRTRLLSEKESSTSTESTTDRVRGGGGEEEGEEEKEVVVVGVDGLKEEEEEDDEREEDGEEEGEEEEEGEKEEEEEEEVEGSERASDTSAKWVFPNPIFLQGYPSRPHQIPSIPDDDRKIVSDKNGKKKKKRSTAVPKICPSVPLSSPIISAGVRNEGKGKEERLTTF
jgi:hypothetical protein